MTKHIGTCQLCLEDNSELRKSHYIPKTLYKATRSVLQSGEILNPVIVDNQNQTLKSTSEQATSYALCALCEKVLNENGENAVLADLRRVGKL